jgi:peptide/nickel transport system substrate-binding protein
MLRRSTRQFCALLAVSALALSGCSASGGAGSSGSETKTLVTAVGDNPVNFNRYLTTGAATTIIGSGPIYEGLTRLDSDSKVQPLLAKSWTVSDDGLRYEFKLRPDVTWHDGKKFTSEDVKFTIEKFFPLSAQLSAFSKTLKTIDTPDELTVVVTLGAPFSPLLAALSEAWILPKHVFTTSDVAADPANNKPVGTGPFKFDTFVSGDRVELSQYDGYWGTKSNVSKMFWKIMPDANARMLALQSGELDWLYTSYVDKTQMDRMDQSKFTKYPQIGTKGTGTVFFNTGKAELSSPSVRRAIYQAIDRNAILEKVLNGAGVVPRGPIPAMFKELVKGDVDFNGELPFDPKAAAAALDAAGFKADASGKRFSLRYAFQSIYPQDLALGNLVKANLEAVGINVELQAQDANVWAEKTYSGDFDMSYLNFASFEDPSLGVSRLYLCNNEKTKFRNASGNCDQEVDQALTQAGQASDPSQRAEYFAKAEKRILETMPAMPLLSANAFSVSTPSTDLTGVFKYWYMDWSAASKK